MSQEKRKNWTVEITEEENGRYYLQLRFRGEFITAISSYRSREEAESWCRHENEGYSGVAQSLEERGARIPGIKWPKIQAAPAASTEGAK